MQPPTFGNNLFVNFMIYVIFFLLHLLGMEDFNFDLKYAVIDVMVRFISDYTQIHYRSIAWGH